MKLTEELDWRGFLHQTTYPDGGETRLNGQPVTFYWGVDPSADSMTVGNLAIIMLVRHFIKHGHKAVLLVGGATGLIGDPDGKAQERELISLEAVNANKSKLIAQYERLFSSLPFEIVDNYDWFKDMHYLEFLRGVGKHVSLAQMLGREFISSRLGEGGNGISYAEFSYVLIQAYDFLRLYQDKQVTLQLCGSDQWGNSIAGVDLIRRVTTGEAHVYAAPLIVNPVSGQKFGKTEAGAIWLDPEKTSPTQFYQFWVNQPDDAVETHLKIFTDLDKAAIDALMTQQRQDPGSRPAQLALAVAVTEIVHGVERTEVARVVTDILTGKVAIGTVTQAELLDELRKEIPAVEVAANSLLVDVLVQGRLSSSKTEARQLIAQNAISVNGQRFVHEKLSQEDFGKSGRMLVRRGKAYKDTLLVELT